MKAFAPFILIAIAIGLFFFKVNPEWQNVKALQAEAGQYNEALEVVKELRELRVELQKNLDNFPTEDLSKLEKFIPDNFDTIRLTLDISSLASRHSIQLKDIKTSEMPASVTARPDQGGMLSYNAGNLEFSFDASYQNALLFLEDVERSLRLTDVVGLSVKTSTASAYTFDVKLQTYWINPKK